MSGQNRTEHNSRVTTTTLRPRFHRRPQVIKMRDLSPATRARITAEYYQSYDVMTGVRIAATLGGLITLFALFLFYKSRCKPEKPPPRIDLDDVISQSYSDSSSGFEINSPIPAAHGGFAPPPTPVPPEPLKPRKVTVSVGSDELSTSREVASTSQMSSELIRPSSCSSVKTKLVRTTSRQSCSSISSVSSSSPSSAKSSCSSPDAVVAVEEHQNVTSSSATVIGRSSISIPPFTPHMVVVKCHGDKIVLSR